MNGRRDATGPTVPWIAAGFAVGLAFVLALGLRIAMLEQRLPVEGQFAVNVQYAPWYLANNGTLLRVETDIPTVSAYTGGVDYGAVDFTATLLHGAALLTAGMTDPVEIGTAYMFLPWQPLVLLPLAVVAIYGRACRLLGTTMKPIGVVLLYLLAVFGHYSMVAWGLSGGLGLVYGWVIFLGIYLVLLARDGRGRTSLAWGAYLVLLLCLLQPTYHTIAVAIVVLTTTVALLRPLGGHEFVPMRTVVLGAVVFVAFLAYHATPFLESYSSFGLSLLADLLRRHDAAASQYLFRLQGPIQAVQVVNYFAIALVTIVLVLSFLRTTGSRKKVLRYHLVWLVGLVPLAGGFYAWDGVRGVTTRLLQIGILLTFAAGAIVLAGSSLRSRLSVGLSVVLATSISVVSVHAIGIGQTALISNAEWQAIKWYGATGCRKVMFTDFRIGSVMTYKGCFDVVGPSAASLAKRGQSGTLEDLYYAGDPTRISHAVDRFGTVDGRRPELILISREMLKPDAGPVLEDGRLVPMTQEAWAAYQDLPGWTTAFSNGEVIVLERLDDGKRSERDSRHS